MSGWKVLENAIPKGSADIIADLMSVSGDTVRRW